MLLIKAVKSPAQNVLNLINIVHLALVLRSLPLTLGALNSMLGAIASMISAPFLTSVSRDFIALLIVRTTVLYWCLNCSGHLFTATTATMLSLSILDVPDRFP